MSVFYDPYSIPISFSSEHMGPSKDFYHIHVPTADNVSLFVSTQLVLNSPEAFLLFVPKSELTFEQAFFPSDLTHSVVIPKRKGGAHKILLGTILVGLKKPYNSKQQFTPADFSNVVCFYNSENGPTLNQMNGIALNIIKNMRSRATAAPPPADPPADAAAAAEVIS